MASRSLSTIQPTILSSATRAIPAALPKIKCITLDIMGTLIGYNKSFGDLFAEKASWILRPFSPTPDHNLQEERDRLKECFANNLKKMKHSYPCYGHNDLSTKDWWYKCLKGAAKDAYGDDLNMDKFDSFFAKLYSTLGSNRVYTAYKDDFPFLDWVKQNDISLGIVSNGSERYLDGLLPLFGLESHFDFSVLAKNLGYEKPDWRVFEEAHRASGVQDPSQILHIGSSVKKDCYPARAYGLQTILLDRYDTHNDSVWVKHQNPAFNSLNHIKHYIQQNDLIADAKQDSTMHNVETTGYSFDVQYPVIPDMTKKGGYDYLMF